MDSPLTKSSKTINSKKNSLRQKNRCILQQLGTSPLRKIKIRRSRKSILREKFLKKSQTYSHPTVKRVISEIHAVSKLRHRELEPVLADDIQEDVLRKFGRTRSQTSRHALLPGLAYNGGEHSSVQHATFVYNDLISNCVDDVDDYIELCQRGQKLEQNSKKFKRILPTRTNNSRESVSITFIRTPSPSKTPDMAFLQKQVDDEYDYYLIERLS